MMYITYVQHLKLRRNNKYTMAKKNRKINKSKSNNSYTPINNKKIKIISSDKKQRISKLPTDKGFVFPRTVKKFIPDIGSRYKLEIPYTDYSDDTESKLAEFNIRKPYKVIARIAKIILSPNESNIRSRCHLVKFNNGYSIQSNKFSCFINTDGILKFLISRNNPKSFINDNELAILYKLFCNIHHWCTVIIKKNIKKYKYVDTYKEMYSDFYELSWFLQMYIMNKQINSTYRRINNLEIKGCLYKHIKDNDMCMNKNLLSSIIIKGLQELYNIPINERKKIDSFDIIDLENEMNLYIKKIWECLQECLLEY